MSEKKPLCIYHGNCADGFTAAWAVWKRFGDAWDYCPGTYQNPPPDVSGRDVVLVDFSYKRDVMRAMRGHGGYISGKARSVLVLDHHKSAAEDLGTRDGNFCTQIADWTGELTWERHLENAALDEMEGAVDSVYCLFDMSRSGAGIAWDFFHGAAARPKLVKYAEDRDLWRFVLPFTREIHAAMSSYPFEFAAWDEIAAKCERGELIAEGAAIDRKHLRDVETLIGMTKTRTIIMGHDVPIANLPVTMCSDAGNIMAKDEPFAVTYFDGPGHRHYSLRSTETGLDVSMIAKAYGGGGHRNAAGFKLPHGVTP